MTNLENISYLLKTAQYYVDDIYLESESTNQIFCRFLSYQRWLCWRVLFVTESVIVFFPDDTLDDVSRRFKSLMLRGHNLAADMILQFSCTPFSECCWNTYILPWDNFLILSLILIQITSIYLSSESPRTKLNKRGAWRCH